MSNTTESAALALSQIPVGEIVEVIAVVADRETKWRLMDLGMVPGTRVEVLRASPLGDPVAYRLRGTMIALRRQDAEVVQVRRLASASTASAEGEGNSHGATR